jgi:hypothetical protein
VWSHRDTPTHRSGTSAPLDLTIRTSRITEAPSNPRVFTTRVCVVNRIGS